MKLKLLLSFLVLNLCITYAQDVENPVIETDTELLCPSEDSYGTASIVNDEEYDSYQWYFKYMFFDEEFDPIEGATEASFTYDWYTYDVSYIKVIATKDGETYESNQILVDSYTWSSLTVTHNASENVLIDGSTGAFLICDGDTIENTINSPYEIVQWYKDNVAIEGATGTSYTITEPGLYKVIASPEFCPDQTSSTIFLVDENTECDAMGIDQNELQNLTITNPVTNTLSIANPTNIAIEDITIYNMNGQQMNINIDNTTQINVSNLKNGLYILSIKATGGVKNLKFVKQ